MDTRLYVYRKWYNWSVDQRINADLLKEWTAWAKKLDVPLVNLKLAKLDPQDLVGIPVKWRPKQWKPAEFDQHAAGGSSIVYTHRSKGRRK